MSFFPFIATYLQPNSFGFFSLEEKQELTTFLRSQFSVVKDKELNPSQLSLLRVEWIDTVEMNNCTIQISVSILLIILRSTCVTMGLNHRSHGKDLRL